MRTNSFDTSKTDTTYGRQHARTAELYRKKREARALAEQKKATAEAPVAPMSVTAEAPMEPMGGEAPPTMRKEDLADVTPAQASEGLRDRAQHAVETVVQAAKEAANLHPLQGAKKLAGDVVSGALQLARQVSARKAKGPSKKR